MTHMSVLARKIASAFFKTALFMGLYFLAIRYVHTYPLPMPLEQQHTLIEICKAFGVDNSENFYIFGLLILDFFIAIIAYLYVVKCWQHWRDSKKI